MSPLHFPEEEQRRICLQWRFLQRQWRCNGVSCREQRRIFLQWRFLAMAFPCNGLSSTHPGRAHRQSSAYEPKHYSIHVLLFPLSRNTSLPKGKKCNGILFFVPPPLTKYFPLKTKKMLWKRTSCFPLHETVRPNQWFMFPYCYIDFIIFFYLSFSTNIYNPVPWILFSRIWISAQDHAVLGLLLNLVGFFISTRPTWSGGNVLYHWGTSFEAASRGDQPLNILALLKYFGIIHRVGRDLSSKNAIETRRCCNILVRGWSSWQRRGKPIEILRNSFWKEMQWRPTSCSSLHAQFFFRKKQKENEKAMEFYFLFPFHPRNTSLRGKKVQWKRTSLSHVLLVRFHGSFFSLKRSVEKKCF